METKKDIRIQFKEKRSSIPKKVRQEKSDRITELVTSHQWFKEAAVLYCYMDFGGEVMTRELMRKAWQLGKEVAVPKVRGEDMDFYAISSFDSLIPSAFGVPEPSRGELKNGTKGLVIVPGIAFDKKRNRIGYGKGYYDRYLIKHQELKTMAVAFEEQIAETLPFDEYDIRPDILITDKRIEVRK